MNLQGDMNLQKELESLVADMGSTPAGITPIKQNSRKGFLNLSIFHSFIGFDILFRYSIYNIKMKLPTTKNKKML